MKRTGPSAKVRGIVMARDAGRCRRCGAIGHEIQHRIGRGMGGSSRGIVNDPSALVLMCRPCHKFITEHPGIAYETGWAIRRSSHELPSEVPLMVLDGSQLFLTEEGTAVSLQGVGVGRVGGGPPSTDGEVALSRQVHTVPASPSPLDYLPKLSPEQAADAAQDAYETSLLERDQP
jgi:5-methylcytosine-specific restriction protein A